MFPSVLLLAALLPPTFALEQANGIGRLPALGWNSWNAYHCDVSADRILDAANLLVSKGFKAAGYEYVNIDDCWSNKAGRDKSTHQLVPDATRFPKGIKGLADQVHGMGLKLGIYSSAGYATCAGYPASIDYEKVDAATFASWGIDYLKYDNCLVPDNYKDTCHSCIPDSTFNPKLVNGTCVDRTGLCADGYDYSKSNTAMRFGRMRDALLAQKRPILYSICAWGTDNVWEWGNATGQSWRTTNDINPSFSRVLNIINQNSFLTNFGDFYGHNDPDMLEIGNGAFTQQEARTHFALWALMKSPLIIGTDLSQLSQFHIDLLQNRYLLAFNQDPIVGRGAAPYKWGVNPDWTFDSTHPAEYWSGPSTDGTMVAMMNTLDTVRVMRTEFKDVPGLDASNYIVIDVWTGKNLGCQPGFLAPPVKPHDTSVFLVKAKC